MSSALLFRWTAHSTADGTLFYPPEGRLTAGVHVRERLRPLERTHDIVRVAIRHLAANVEITKVGPIESLATDEGEYAAIIELDGKGRDPTGHAMKYVIGFVFGDDFYDRIDGYFSESPKSSEYHSLIRAYVLAYRLNLGEFRSRRFYYDPPAGWQGRARNMLAQWFTFDYPKRPSQMIVSAAYPSTKIEASVTARALIQRRLIGFKQERETGESFPPTEAGLHMGVHHVVGRFENDPSITDLCTVVATDQRYVYVTRLETSTQWFEEDRAALMKLAGSIRPLPRKKLDEKTAMSWMAE
jgi:hypothetical protein